MIISLTGFMTIGDVPLMKKNFLKMKEKYLKINKSRNLDLNKKCNKHSRRHFPKIKKLLFHRSRKTSRNLLTLPILFFLKNYIDFLINGNKQKKPLPSLNRFSLPITLIKLLPFKNKIM